MMTVSSEAEKLLIALVERVKSFPGVRQVRVFRLEQDPSNGIAELAQPHVDESDVGSQWRLETKSELIDQLCAAQLFEKAPSGARMAPDRWIIRAGIPTAALQWYEERQRS
jgi:hypothetical protein